jgi:hypothetical protein
MSAASAAVAIASGLAGGIIRDVLLQRGPPLALVHPVYLVIALGGSALAFLVASHGRLWQHAYLYVDALALGCWAATRAESAAGRRPGRRAAPAGLPPRARCPGPDSARYPCLHDPRSPRHAAEQRVSPRC